MSLEEALGILVREEKQKLIEKFLEDWEKQRIKISNYIQSNFFDENLNDAIMDDKLFEKGKKKWWEMLNK